MKTYGTSEIAKLIGVHPNTVRLYEEAGFITPPERRANGYRVYTELHVFEMQLARLALRAEVLQNGLRKKAVEIIRLGAALDFGRAAETAQAYEGMLTREIENAKAAIAAVEALLDGKHKPEGLSLRRLDAAKRLNVTVDTLRNWELNGLISVKRRRNGYRVYNAADLERLNIIRTLRCANYSLTAILRLMKCLDKDQSVPIEKVLNTPEANEDIISVCDRLIISLENTREDARRMYALLEAIKQKY